MMRTKKWSLALLCFMTLAWSLTAMAQKPKKPVEEEPASEPAEEEEPEDNYPRPEKVKVGVYINDVQNLDIRSHSYELDVYVWFRWTNPNIDPSSTMEILNPSELWGHMVNPTYTDDDDASAPEELPGEKLASGELGPGELYQVNRIQGRFSKKFPLYNYPYDQQVLEVRFEDTAGSIADVVYELDKNPITMNEKIQLPGFNIGKPSLTIEEHQYPTIFGDTRLKTEVSEKYSSGVISIPIARPMFAYTIKLLTPIFCVILCAALMFLLAPSYVDSRVDVGITSLLTVVALQMTFNQDLPDVGYLMLMDKIYLLSYLFVIGGLAIVVITTKMVDGGKQADAIKLHKQSLIGLTSFYMLASLILVTWAAIEG